MDRTLSRRRFVGALAGLAGLAVARRAPAATPGTPLATLRVVTTDLPPYVVRDGSQVTGSATGAVRAVLARLGIAPIFEVVPWPRAYAEALAIPNMLIYPIARTPEREGHFIWIDQVADYQVHLFRLAARADIVLQRLADAARYAVAGLARDVKTDYLAVHGVRVQPVAHEIDAVAMLLHGRVDLVASDDLAMAARIRELGADPARVVPALPLPEISHPLYMALSRGTDPRIVAAFRNAARRADSRRIGTGAGALPAMAPGRQAPDRTNS